MTASPPFDSSFLLEDLRLGVSYAARAGLLKDDTALAMLSPHEAGGTDSADLANSASSDKSIVRALNEISQLIAPMTIADLRFGRDPFDPANQRRSKRIQGVLTFSALLILLLIGYFMHALRQEQDAIVVLNSLQQLKPVEKLTSLRKLVQYETPFSNRATLYDEYHQRLIEIANMRSRIQNSFNVAFEAIALPLFPLESYFTDPDRFWKRPANNGGPSLEDVLQAAAKSSPDQPESCTVDSDGNIRLPSDQLKYPVWMQLVMTDVLSDYCFQLKVLVSDNQSAMVNPEFSAFVEPNVSILKSKVSLRADWFLPFFYGLLGAAVSVMRSVASIRIAAVEALPIVMRIALGGVAGIVIGWFAGSPINSSATISAFSLPFLLAFLAGHSIDAVFAMLDKASRLIGHPAREA